jgi:hypothetical protein
MKRLRFLLAASTLLLGLASCGKKSAADINASVSQLEKVFPPSAPAVAAAPEAVPSSPAPSDPKAYVAAALSAARAQDYASGVLALEEVQKMKQARVVTADQLMAIELAKQAMMADLVTRADRGDPKAKADLAAIEKNHSQ